MSLSNDRSVVWPMTSARSQVYNVDTPAVAFAEVPDTLALFAFLHKEALTKKLDALIDEEADKAAMSYDARKKAENVVLGDILAVERDESALVWSAMAQGLPVLHRRECSPLAILQCALATAPRAEVQGTTPGLSYTLRT
jgi:hypothetical protein